MLSPSSVLSFYTMNQSFPLYYGGFDGFVLLILPSFNVFITVVSLPHAFAS